MSEIIDVKVPLSAVDGKTFYDGKLHVALATCQNTGYDALFIPKIMDLRSNLGKESFIWQSWYSAPSVRVTGTTKGGNNVVVYGHVPNYFSNPENITKAISQGLKNGAGLYPKKEFEKLLGMEDGENVFVIDYNALKNSESGVIKVAGAIDHPQVVPFIGGRERAEVYLKQHENVVGKNIGVWHSDDLHDQPYGRVLFVHFRSLDGYRDGYYNLGSDGRFVGVPSGTVGAVQKIKSPLEKLVGKAVDSGNGIIVLRQDQLTPTEYNLLVRK
jgi:hypothetical protein